MKKKDDICNKCGKCCYYKIKINDIFVFSKRHCEFLDVKTNLCTIYKDRFKKNPKCLAIEEAIKIKALPDNCPYVKDLDNYNGPKWIDS